MTIGPHMNSQKLWQHEQSLHPFSADEILELKEIRTNDPIPNPEAISNCQPLAYEKLVFSTESP